MHFENARFQMLKWDKPSITWENYDKIIISAKWLITQTNDLWVIMIAMTLTGL